MIALLLPCLAFCTSFDIFGTELAQVAGALTPPNLAEIPKILETLRVYLAYIRGFARLDTLAPLSQALPKSTP